MIHKIFNADDYGISLGVNAGIQKAAFDGILNSTSVMVNQKYPEKDLDRLIQKPGFNIGLHINLTNGKALSDKSEIPLLVNEQGEFKHGFLNLFLLGFVHPKSLKHQATLEIENQIRALQGYGAEITHLDSHRHVHMIPAIFGAVLALQKKYDIKRVRIINENPIRTIKTTKGLAYLKDGGLIKWGVLFGCFILNKLLYKVKTKTYFYSILNTCKITVDKVRSIRVVSTYDTIEIMLHPSIPEIDQNHLQDVFDNNILKYERTQELETVLSHDLSDLELR